MLYSRQHCVDSHIALITQVCSCWTYSTEMYGRLRWTYSAEVYCSMRYSWDTPVWLHVCIDAITSQKAQNHTYTAVLLGRCHAIAWMFVNGPTSVPWGTLTTWWTTHPPRLLHALEWVELRTEAITHGIQCPVHDTAHALASGSMYPGSE